MPAVETEADPEQPVVPGRARGVALHGHRDLSEAQLDVGDTALNVARDDQHVGFVRIEGKGPGHMIERALDVTGMERGFAERPMADIVVAIERHRTLGTLQRFPQFDGAVVARA